MIWDVPPSCPGAQPVLPISHQPRQNKAERETAKIKVNPTQVRQEMCHPVEHLPTIAIGDRRRTRVSQRIFQEVQEVQWEVGVKLTLCTQLATRRFFCSSAFQVSSVPFWSPLSVETLAAHVLKTPYVICIKYRRVLNLLLLSVRCGLFN